MTIDQRKQLAHARLMAERCRRMAAEETRQEVSAYLRGLAESFESEIRALAAAEAQDEPRGRRSSG